MSLYSEGVRYYLKSVSEVRELPHIHPDIDPRCTLTPFPLTFYCIHSVKLRLFGLQLHCYSVFCCTALGCTQTVIVVVDVCATLFEKLFSTVYLVSPLCIWWICICIWWICICICWISNLFAVSLKNFSPATVWKVFPVRFGEFCTFKKVHK